jgi:peptidyl-prolyl cis-trans isomerase C
MKKIVGIVFLFLITFSLSYAEDQEVMARVGQKVILKKDFEIILNQNQGPGNNKQFKIHLLNNLAKSMALAELARKKGLDQRPELKRQIELATNEVLAARLVEEEVTSKIIITEEQTKNYYKNNLGQYKIPEQVKVRHILVRLNPPVSDEDKNKARNKIEMIMEKIRSGEDFSKLASEFSDDPLSKMMGGDMGLIQKGKMVKPFDEAAFSLKPGEISPIVETTFGFHIIKVEEKKAEEIRPYESVKDKIRETLYNKLKIEKTGEFITKVMKELDVKINTKLLE